MPKRLVDNTDSILEYLKSLTLLCVEDNKTTQLIYESIFEDMVKDIIFANNGEDGYQKYLEGDVDLIITDYDMPVLNGLEMCESIRTHDKDIPIILVTAIKERDVIVQALHLKINSFIEKPIKVNQVLESVTNASKLLIANEYLEELRNKKIAELEEKDKYSNYQEDLAFQKELNILRNDFYYKMIDCSVCTNSEYHLLVDFLYHPLDTISGDAYSARKVDFNKTFYLIVDGMGKGLSASLTTMIITSYINHLIDKMTEVNNFDFHKLIADSIEYIQPILLEEEAIAIDYVLVDCTTDLLQYAKFAMPASLMQNKEYEILKIRSNNPPLSKYNNTFTISELDTTNITKFLFYSDGVIENNVKNEDKTYIDYIENDFLNSFTKEGFKSKLLSKIDIQEDDITLIFVNKLNIYETKRTQAIFQTSLDEVDRASEWYTQEWENITDNPISSYKASIVFTELFMNAYEHGNLGLTSQEKNLLLEEDIYFEALLEKEKECSKTITVSINTVDYNGDIYIATYIKDEGNGFDTQILSTIFRNSRSFNGRGVFVSRASSLGIYYNTKGNSVLFLNKVEVDE